MKTHGTWLVLLACGALLATAAGPLLADDSIVVTAAHPIRIGALALEPGSYVLRSDSSMGTRNVLSVTSADGRTFFGFVLANYDCAPYLRSTTDKVVYDEKDGQTVRMWIVGWREVGYFFTPAPVPPALAARARAKTGALVAAR